jgi:NADPH-dependent 2,4-dienoyl-CoA reductase/sulfur reductase-like enzyme/peroxiredoxin family protein/rhodanese-related sulfurtransferase/TusA-related sulfurtransferase
MSRTYVIIGGVAGGASAASRLRRLDEQAEIILFERGEQISFANCGLPYHIGGVIPQRERLLLQTPERMWERFRIDVKVQHEVIAIHRKQKEVEVKNLQTNEVYVQKYDKLILSPGVKPLVPNLPGVLEAEHLYTLRSLSDMDQIKKQAEAEQGNAVVIGGGFIGIEMAENLKKLGWHVSLVELADHLLPALDPEMASVVEEHLEAEGIQLYLQEEVSEFRQRGKQVVLKGGSVLPADMIILAVGVTPDTRLAEAAGLELGIRKGIVVNDQLQTSDPDIYAVGDAVQVKDWIHGQPTLIPLAGPASRQGRLVADQIAGRPVAYRGTLGTSIVKACQLAAASTGSSEKTLRKMGAKYEAVHIHPQSHAGFYPGATPLAMKLLFDPDSGKILGAQVVGQKGVDKRIDVLATAIKAGLTVEDLAELELAYAPPYSSAKDPVNLLGFVASNIRAKLLDSVQWHELEDELKQGGLLIDVREPVEYEMGAIPNAINIPLGQLRERLDEIPKDQPLYIYCQAGQRGYFATRILKQSGFEVRNLDGGYKTYKMATRQPKTKEREEIFVKQIQSEQPTAQAKAGNVIQLDACGLQCPGPILQVSKKMKEMNDGDILEIRATDSGFSQDIESWSQKFGHTVLDKQWKDGVLEVRIQKKGAPSSAGIASATAAPTASAPNGTSIIVFSGDLDRAMASMIIATGSAAMGKPTTMFFTFWGLNILRKKETPPVPKGSLEKMFGMMMPKGPGELPLSKMNFAGLGAKMMKYMMDKKNVDSLETLIQHAKDAGVRMVACTMSMDVMGIKEEELIDGIEFGGVATFLAAAEKSGTSLFI